MRVGELDHEWFTAEIWRVLGEMKDRFMGIYGPCTRLIQKSKSLEMLSSREKSLQKFGFLNGILYFIFFSYFWVDA